MKGILVSYRRGRHAQREGQMLIRIEGINSREEAAKLVGRKVKWRNIAGKIVAPHGKKGIVRARFNRGLPGQAMGSEVEIY